MKNRNRYRSEKSRNVKLLENALSLRDRLFSLLAVRRGAKRLQRWAKTALWLVPLLCLLYFCLRYAIDKAYSINIEAITYDSRQGLIHKQQALKILGIENSVNMATLDALSLESRLEANPCIESAHIRAELPDRLHIDVDERIPIVYVELESGSDTGNRQRFFMDPKGYIFPVVKEYHQQFLGVPTWYLQPGDVTELKPGACVEEQRRRPIVELVAAANLYDLTEIPAIREIFRPKEWKIIITLETGTEVQMQVYDIRGQMERLAMVLEHARATGRTIRSADVIPSINPAVIYNAPTQKNAPPHP